MPLQVADLPARLHAALLGAAAGEGAAGRPAGVRQLFLLGDALAAEGGAVDPVALAAAGFDEPPAGGPAALLLRAVMAGLLSPLDRPRLRQASHRLVTLSRGDEGTAITAVATGVLAADLCRFDLETALIRLRQTLLEEAPTALHLRLRPLSWSGVPTASTDPGAALQLALTALDRERGVEAVVESVCGWDGEIGATCALAGALAGARDLLDGSDPDWLARVPAGSRAAEVAARLAACAQAGSSIR